MKFEKININGLELTDKSPEDTKRGWLHNVLDTLDMDYDKEFTIYKILKMTGHDEAEPGQMLKIEDAMAILVEAIEENQKKNQGGLNGYKEHLAPYVLILR